jgi:hypothetical protein
MVSQEKLQVIVICVASLHLETTLLFSKLGMAASSIPSFLRLGSAHFRS